MKSLNQFVFSYFVSFYILVALHILFNVFFSFFIQCHVIISPQSLSSPLAFLTTSCNGSICQDCYSDKVDLHCLLKSQSFICRSIQGSTAKDYKVELIFLVKQLVFQIDTRIPFSYLGVMATAIRELDSLDDWMTEWGDLSNEIKVFKVQFHVILLFKF